MSTKDDKHIKDIIRKIAANKAPNDFTKNVMKDVFMMSSNEEALKSKELTSLLKRTVREKPSQDFMEVVMGQIETQKKIIYKPLISKKGWFIISGTIIAMVVFVFFNATPNESSAVYDSVLPYLEETKHLFANPFKHIKFSPLLTIGLLCLSSMLLFDTLLKRRLLSNS